MKKSQASASSRSLHAPQTHPQQAGPAQMVTMRQGVTRTFFLPGPAPLPLGAGSWSCGKWGGGGGNSAVEDESPSITTSLPGPTPGWSANDMRRTEHGLGSGSETARHLGLAAPPCPAPTSGPLSKSEMHLSMTVLVSALPTQTPCLLAITVPRPWT